MLNKLYFMELKKFFVLVLLLGSVCPAFCGGDTLHCRFYFPVGSAIPDLSYRDNGPRLDSFLSSIRSLQERAVLRRVRLRSGASPEGNSMLNRRLSDERLVSLRAVMRERLSVPDSVLVCLSSGEDWEGLSVLVGESDMPCRDEVLRILRDTPVWVVRGGKVVDSRKRQLMNLRGGSVWRYMAEHFFPELRNCTVVECEFGPVISGNDREIAVYQKEAEARDTVILRDTVERTVVIRDTVQVPASVGNASSLFTWV